MEIDQDFLIEPVRRELAQHRPAPADQLLDDGPGLALHLDDTVLTGIRQQAAAQPDVEVGGILLGRHFVKGSGWVVTVTDHLPVPSDSASALHFEFDRSSIHAIAARMTDSEADYIVGWYHSHVGGEPFMSETDHRLHRDHFDQPWYVSAVVAAGEWGLPVGFWRLTDNGFEPIDDHLVRMTGPNGAAERHQRFLEGCVPRDDGAGQVGPIRLLSALGLDSGRLASILDGVSGSHRHYGDDIEQLRFLVESSLTAAADPSCAAELAALRERLTLTRPRGGRLRLASSRFKERIVIHGSECYSFTEGDKLIERFDLVRRLVLPVRVESPPLSIAFGAGGALWVLMANRQLMRVETTRKEESERAARFEFNFMGFRLPALDDEPVQAVADEEAVWLRTARTWHRLPFEQQGDRTVLGAGTRGDLPPGRCSLLSGWDVTQTHTIGLLSVDGAQLRVWRAGGDGWSLATEITLDEPWRRWPILDVCLGDDEVYVLFDDGDANQIAAFDLRAQRLSTHIVGVAGQEPALAICTDHLGRLHTRVDQLLCRL